MKTLQEVGTEILTGSPKQIYILTGPEFGIKTAYIQALKKLYGEYKELEHISDFVSMMSVKHLIPLTPCVYVVRYDDDFITSLNEVTANQLLKLKIVGTLVCIYSDAKHSAKLEKFLPDITTSVDAVAPQFIFKYLHRDHPNIPTHIVQSIIKYSTDYSQADLWCATLDYLDESDLYSITDDDIVKLFGVGRDTSETRFKQKVAARNFAGCMLILEEVSQYDTYIYSILSVMIELEKLATNKYVNSPYKEFTSAWTSMDIYNMFEHTFQELVQLRAGTGDPYNSIIYLLSLTQFAQVPQWEEN